MLDQSLQQKINGDYCIILLSSAKRRGVTNNNVREPGNKIVTQELQTNDIDMYNKYYFFGFLLLCNI